MIKRVDGRDLLSLRPVTMDLSPSLHAEGSALISLGDTQVLCTATVENRVPPFLRGAGRGWVTAEYGMLPRSTRERNPRPGGGRVVSRSLEIQRFIGRSLRAVVDLEQLGEKTIIIDADVLQADGGTRTASVTGGFVALILALHWLKQRGETDTIPVHDYLAAISVGLFSQEILLDLNHGEDSSADVDLNVVGTGAGDLVEIQGTAESRPFSRRAADLLLDAAQEGIKALVAHQKNCIGYILDGDGGST